MSKKSVSKRSIRDSCKNVRSDPERMKKIFQASIVDDFIDNSRKVTIEHQKSRDCFTKTKIDSSIEYSKIIQNTVTRECQGPDFKKSIKKLRDVKRKENDFFSSSSYFTDSLNRNMLDCYTSSSSLTDDVDIELSSRFESLSTSGSEN